MVESDRVADFMSDDTTLYAKLDFIWCAEDYEMHLRSHVTLQFQLDCKIKEPSVFWNSFHMKFSVFSVNSHTAVISVSNFLHFSNEIFVVWISISELIYTLNNLILDFSKKYKNKILVFDNELRKSNLNRPISNLICMKGATSG